MNEFRVAEVGNVFFIEEKISFLFVPQWLRYHFPYDSLAAAQERVNEMIEQRLAEKTAKYHYSK